MSFDHPADTLIVTIWEDTGCTIMARIYGNAGTAITQASLTAITCTVSKIGDGTTVATPSVTISSVVYDTLQTSDPRWTRAGGDSTGFNFLLALAQTNFPTGEEWYFVDIAFDPVSGADFALCAKVFAKARYAS